MTNLVERRESKCIKYWPEKEDIVTVGSGPLEATVELRTEIDGNAWTMREFAITFKKTQERRILYQVACPLLALVAVACLANTQTENK